MSENSLQNQKNEVSFVLSEKAKAIIEKFEARLREGNYTAEEKNGIRAELVWLLLGQKFPKIVKKVEDIELLSKSHLQNAKVVLEQFRKEEPLLSLGLILLRPVVPIQHYGILEKEQIKLLYDEIPAVVDYYCYVIVNYDAAYSVFKDKYFEFCMRLYGYTNNVKLLHNKDTSYPLWWVFFNMDSNYTPYDKRNRYVPDEQFDLVILSEDKDVASKSTFFLNGNTFQMKDFINNHLSDNGTLFYKAPDFCINKAAWLPFRKWVIENKFLHGVIQLPRNKEGGQILVIKKQKTDSIFFVDAIKDFWEDNTLNAEKLLEVIHKKNPEYYKENALKDFVCQNNNYDTSVSRQFVAITDEGTSVVTLGDLIDLHDSKVEEDFKCFFIDITHYSGSWNPQNYFGNSETLWPSLMPIAKRLTEDKFFLFRLADYGEGAEAYCTYIEKDNKECNFIDNSRGIDFEEVHNDDFEPILGTYFNSFVFSIKENPIVPIEPDYLVKALISEATMSQINCYEIDSDMQISEEDFLSIEIAIPSLRNQRSMIDLDRQNTKKDSMAVLSGQEIRDVIKVLWVGYNDKTKKKANPSLFEITITARQCWKDAEQLLENRDSFSQWSAIVFGPQFKMDSTSPSISPNVVKFSNKLTRLFTTNNTTIPWYVVTEGKDDTLALYSESFERESDWGTFMYNLDSKEQMLSLFETIKKVNPFKNSRNRIKYQYSKVYEAIKEYFEPESEPIMTDILSALHYPEENKDFQPVLYYNRLRQMVEYLFRAANRIGLLPDCFIEDGKVNLTGSSLYLAGKTFIPSKKVDFQSIRYGNEGDTVFPHIISSAVRNLLEMTHAHSHTTEFNKEDEDELLAYYLETQSAELLFGYALQLCEVIVWFGKYAKNHSNRELNLAKCKRIELQNVEILFPEYEGKTLLLEQDEKGNLHAGSCLVHKKHQKKVGRMVVLGNIVKNTVKETKNLYLYFANTVKLYERYNTDQQDDD